MIRYCEETEQHAMKTTDCSNSDNNNAIIDKVV